MPTLNLKSREFQDVIHNLRLENMSLSIDLQKKVIEVVTSGITVTPELIKRIAANGKV